MVETMSQQTTKKTKPSLSNVPETMLWTLHNRANEAMRSDGVIHDEKCIQIYESIDYDYERSFGKPQPSHGMRSKIFDDAISDFLGRYPDAVIINLGEGLETQRYRFADNPHVRYSQWYSVDLPDAIAIRERFITPDEKHHHIASSALDSSWLQSVPSDLPVFISAQGLFMYFEEAHVKTLIQQMLSYFEQGEVMFDVIPRWLSKKACSEQGFKITPDYITPRMPWGINRNEAKPTIRAFSEHIQSVHEVQFNFPRGVWHWLVPVFSKLPVLKNILPGIYKVRF